MQKAEEIGPKAESWRLFIAIVLPESVKDAVEKTQMELRGAVPDKSVRWAKRAQFHLTLRFLGDVEASRVGALTEALLGACRDFPALHLRSEGIGFFPDARHPRVIWVGVRDETGMLPKLHDAIEAAVGNFTGEEAEGKFTGHVTLGRCPGIKRPQAEVLSRLSRDLGGRRFGEWIAHEVELLRSELLPGGARHTTIAAVPLGPGSGQEAGD